MALPDQTGPSITQQNIQQSGGLSGWLSNWSNFFKYTAANNGGLLGFLAGPTSPINNTTTQPTIQPQSTTQSALAYMRGPGYSYTPPSTSSTSYGGYGATPTAYAAGSTPSPQPSSTYSNLDPQAYATLFGASPYAGVQSSIPTTDLSVTPQNYTDTNNLTQTPTTGFDLQALLDLNKQYQQSYLQAAQMSPRETDLLNQLNNIKAQEQQYGIDTQTAKLNQFYLGRPLELSTGRAEQVDFQRQLGAQTLTAQENLLANQAGVASQQRQTSAQAIQGASQMLNPLYNLATPQRIAPGEQLYNPLTGKIVGGSSLGAAPSTIASYAGQLATNDANMGVVRTTPDGQIDNQYYYQMASGILGGHGSAISQMPGYSNYGSANGNDFTQQYTTQQGNIPQVNNNPLNIKLGGATQQWLQQGATLGSQAKDGGQFLKFQNPQQGFVAGMQLLQSPVYSGLTVDAAMKKWSGGGYGASQIGQGAIANTKVSQLSPTQMYGLMHSMAQEEGFYAAPTEQKQNTAGINGNYLGFTQEGTPYVNMEKVNALPQAQKQQIIKAASTAGIPLLAADEVDKVRNIQVTKQNLRDLSNLAQQVLGSGVGGRIAGSIATTWNNIFQNDPNGRGKFQQYRTAALNAIQALAGGSGSGFRLTQGEIDTATTNIPNPNDNIETANAKLQVLNSFLDKWTRQILPNAQIAAASTGSASAYQVNGQTYTQGPDGLYYAQ